MKNSENKVSIRQMFLSDLDIIFTIDHMIRRKEEPITYLNLTTENIFSINRHVGRNATPMSYVDLITGDVSDLLKFGFVAEVQNHIRGFILGRVGHISETVALAGEIIILGVHPDYQRIGIASQLVVAINEKFQSFGVKSINIDIDQRDKKLVNFVEQLGFGVGHFVKYSKPL
ncbi:GNAT family N-acetyltransferase [Chloroflexota bacterium]